MRNTLLICALMISLTQSYGQGSLAFNFQGLILDGDQNPNINKQIELNVILYSDAQGQNIVFEEVHDAVTNNKGVFDINIGAGTPIAGSFNNIDWLAYIPWMELIYDINNGNGSQSLGLTRFNSVPFCFSSKYIVCSQGLPGQKGRIGPSGFSGAFGQSGATGPQGPIGNTGADGADALPILPLLSEPPTGQSTGSVYMDDGTNREDTLPGFRAMIDGEWVDL